MQPCLTRPTWEPLVSYAGLSFGTVLLDDAGCVLSDFHGWELTEQEPGVVWSEDLDCLIHTVAGRIHRFRCQAACLYEGFNLLGMCRARLEQVLCEYELSWSFAVPDDPLEMVAFVKELGALFWVPDRTGTVSDIELISPGRDHERRAKVAAMQASEKLDDPWRALKTSC